MKCIYRSGKLVNNIRPFIVYISLRLYCKSRYVLSFEGDSIKSMHSRSVNNFSGLYCCLFLLRNLPLRWLSDQVGPECFAKETPCRDEDLSKSIITSNKLNIPFYWNFITIWDFSQGVNSLSLGPWTNIFDSCHLLLWVGRSTPSETSVNETDQWASLV